MTDRKLRLVYSSHFPDSKMAGIGGLDYVVAKQPDLFVDLEGFHAILVPVDDVNQCTFRRVLTDHAPKLIIETRPHPDFFMIYSTIPAARNHFDRLGIEYKRIPVYDSESERENWAHLTELKSTLGSYIEKRTGAPVLFFLSNIRHMDLISDKLKGYISQEIAEVRFERIEQ